MNLTERELDRLAFACFCADWHYTTDKPSPTQIDTLRAVWGKASPSQRAHWTRIVNAGLDEFERMIEDELPELFGEQPTNSPCTPTRGAL